MYVKLFQKILDSSIWLERDSTRIVWITLLASMDSEGFCAFASLENLARRAQVKPSHARMAIEVLEAPDHDSSGDEHEGRRIARVQGGWMVLNARKYREITRSGELRPKRKNPAQLGATGRNSAQVDLPTDLTTNGINKSVPEAEAEADINTTTTANVDVVTPPEAKPPKKKRKKFSFDGYGKDVSEVVNYLAPKWPRVRRGDKNKSAVDVSPAKCADRIEALIAGGLSAEVLKEVGDMYLAEDPEWPSCPHFFFGKAEDAPYLPYLKMLIHQRSKAQ